jgi:hypothetical protein
MIVTRAYDWHAGSSALVAQVIDPGSKLAIARGLRDATAASSLGEVLGLGSCDEDDLYAASQVDVMQQCSGAARLLIG